MTKRIKLGACTVAALAAGVLAVSATPAAAVGTYSGLPYVSGGGDYSDDFGDEGILRLGGKSNAVCMWQRILWSFDYLQESDIDGAFGPKTEQATKNLQNRYNLRADGVVGKDTFGAVDSRLGYLQGSVNDGQVLVLGFTGPAGRFLLTRDQWGHYLFPDGKNDWRAAGYDYLTCS